VVKVQRRTEGGDAPGRLKADATYLCGFTGFCVDRYG